MLITPSVSITEVDNSIFTPNDPSDIAAFVGIFEKGPINKPIFITNVAQLKNTFGRGIGLYYNDWFQVYNFLQYATGIWVCRTAGIKYYNASNVKDKQVFFEIDDFTDKIDKLQTHNGLRVVAKEPGEYGNLYSVAIISKNTWDNNEKIFDTYYPKQIFKFFDDSYKGICVFRKNELVEQYYVNEKTIYNMNDVSTTSLYWKFDNYENILDSYGDDIHILSDGITTLPVNTDFIETYDILKNKDSYFFDIIIGNQLNNSLAVELAEYRKDCIAFIGLPSEYINYLALVENEITYVVEGKPVVLSYYRQKKKYSENDYKNLDNYINSIPRSQFCHFTMNVKEQYDPFTDKMALVNIAGDIAGLKAKASVDRPWGVGAGLERGQIKNIQSSYIKFNKNIHEKYYLQGLNYIENNILMTQKTFITESTSFNRVNIRSLFNFIEKNLEYIMKKYIFEPNSLEVKRNISNDINIFLKQLKEESAIYDATSNIYTKENVIIAEIVIMPVYVAEYINLRITNNGSNINIITQ